MTNLFDALEFILREVEEGADMEAALARFPEYADELRPILETSAKARTMAAPEPSPDVIRRSRARVMHYAAEMRESKIAPRRPALSLFQRLALSFALAAILLLSGNGLLSASASTLPGERLYPVKRGWENVRLFLIFDKEARDLLEGEFKNERLHEVDKLLSQGRNQVIDFAGLFMQVNGVYYISGVQVVLPAGIPVPANGAPVLASGQTNVQGFVEILSLEVLPEGSSVPMGKPVVVETDSAEDTVPETQTSSGSGGEAVDSEISGTLNVIAVNSLVVNGMTVFLDNPIIEGNLCIGILVDLKGYFAEDGRFIVREVKSLGDCSSKPSSSSNSIMNNSGNVNSGNSSLGGENNSNDNSDDGSNDNGDEDDDDDNEDGDDD